MKSKKDKNKAAVKLGRLGGLKAASNMTKAQRDARATKASRAAKKKRALGRVE